MDIFLWAVASLINNYQLSDNPLFTRYVQNNKTSQQTLIPREYYFWLLSSPLAWYAASLFCKTFTGRSWALALSLLLCCKLWELLQLFLNWRFPPLPDILASRSAFFFFKKSFMSKFGSELALVLDFGFLSFFLLSLHGLSNRVGGFNTTSLGLVAVSSSIPLLVGGWGWWWWWVSKDGWLVGLAESGVNSSLL